MPEAGAADWPATLAQHDRWLRTVLFARLREWDAVEDVFQEVALAAVRFADRGGVPDRLAPWLYRVAVRQAMLHRRHGLRRRRLQEAYAERMEAAAGERANSNSNPLAWLISDERKQSLQAAIGRLPRRDREVLLLKYLEQWTYAQISAHLGFSESAVESRLHRARRRLRAELADHVEIR